MKKIFISILTVLFYTTINAQSANDVLDLLIKNETIQQAEADSLRADAAIKEQEAAAKKKSFNLTAGKALQLSGYTHIRYRMQEESGENDGFDIRRAYIDFKGNLSPYFSYRLQTDFAKSPKIMDAQVDLKIKDYINFTFGQQGLPFSLNSVTSNAKLELADRAQAVEALAARGDDVIGNMNGRDIGITMHGKLIELNDLMLIDYKLGLFNGAGINVADNDEAKDFVGRLLFHPIDGIDAGVSYYNGWTSNPDELEDTLAFGKRTRFGTELNIDYSIFNLKGEYLVGSDGPLDRAGWYIQAGAFVWKEKLQLVGRYDTYDQNKDGASTGDISTLYTLGCNIFFTKNILLQIAYNLCDEEAGDFTNNLGSIQLQASF